MRRLGRQQQREARAFSRCAFHRDFSFVQVHITFDQMQSDTAAGIHGMALCAFALVETHENVFQVLGRDAYAGVADGDADAVRTFACRGDFLPSRLYGDETAFGGELHGVGKQVVQHACHLFCIQTEQVFLPERALAGQSDVPFVGEWAEMVHVVFDERFDLHGRQFQLFAFLFQTAEIEQLVDKPEQVAGVTEYLFQFAFEGGVAGFADEQFERGDDERERRAQLVADVGEEAEFEFVEMLLLLPFQVFLFCHHARTLVGDV